jgi:hypothetical protein
MQTIKLLLVTVLATFSALACAQSIKLDPNLSLNITLNGQVIPGGKELTTRLAAAKTQTERNAVYDSEALPPFNPGQTLKLTVSVKNMTTGVAKTYNDSPNIRVETFGCLTYYRGVITVSPSRPEICASTEYPQLWVMLTDTAGNVQAMNTYLLRGSR